MNHIEAALDTNRVVCILASLTVGQATTRPLRDIPPAAPRHQTVRVDGGRIIQVLDDSRRPAHAQARKVLDAQGRRLTPGFVDAHFHSEMRFGDSAAEAAAMCSRDAAHSSPTCSNSGEHSAIMTHVFSH